MGEKEWRLKPYLQSSLAQRICVRLSVVNRDDYRFSIVNVVKVDAVYPWTIAGSEAGQDAITGRYETQGT